MSNYLKVKMEDGSELYIETVETGVKAYDGLDSGLVESEYGDIPAMSIDTVKEKAIEATELFGKVLPAATGFAKGVAEQIRKDISSDEMELEFSIALNGEAKAAICSGGVETCFNVKLKWKKADANTTPQNGAEQI